MTPSRKGKSPRILRAYSAELTGCIASQLLLPILEIRIIPTKFEGMSGGITRRCSRGTLAYDDSIILKVYVSRNGTMSAK